MINTSQIVVANWKMNGDILLLQGWLNELSVAHYKVILCPPMPLLPLAKEHLRQIDLGAQDCHFEERGAYTGFTSPLLLKNVGCDFVILGHSERRSFETDAIVAKKAKAAQEAGLTPIICVGESLAVRQEGKHIDFVLNQLRAILPTLGSDFIIAYEPLWAIGTGLTANLLDIEEMHRAINDLTHTKILYGGSVKPDNAGSILSMKYVDGLLVGGASLNIEDFNSILAS